MRWCLALLLIGSLRAAPDLAPLEAWLARQQKVRTLQADFVQQRQLPGLKRPVETPGKLAMTAAGQLRWTLGDPPRTIALVDAATVTLIEVGEKKARRMDAEAPAARPFAVFSGRSMTGGLESFLEIFEPVEARTIHGIYQLTTRPKPRPMRRQVQWVFFDIHPASGALRAIEMQLDDRTRIRTVFSNLRVNQAIPPATFEFDLEGYAID